MTLPTAMVPADEPYVFQLPGKQYTFPGASCSCATCSIDVKRFDVTGAIERGDLWGTWDDASLMLTMDKDDKSNDYSE